MLNGTGWFRGPGWLQNLRTPVLRVEGSSLGYLGGSWAYRSSLGLRSSKTFRLFAFQHSQLYYGVVFSIRICGSSENVVELSLTTRSFFHLFARPKRKPLLSIIQGPQALSLSRSVVSHPLVPSALSESSKKGLHQRNLRRGRCSMEVPANKTANRNSKAQWCRVR